MIGPVLIRIATAAEWLRGKNVGAKWMGWLAEPTAVLPRQPRTHVCWSGDSWEDKTGQKGDGHQGFGWPLALFRAVFLTCGLGMQKQATCGQ